MDKYPDNTMISFDGALRVGCNGLETGLPRVLGVTKSVDVHMSRDGVVVVCHDAVLKRLYGVDGTVDSLDWEGGLDQLRTVREPHSPMITFRQLLEKMVSAEGANGVGNGLGGGNRPTSWSDTWVLMDIKVYPFGNEVGTCRRVRRGPRGRTEEPD